MVTSELRSAIRSLLHNPRFTLVSVLLPAFGVGTPIVLFALADAVMFRPFLFADQNRLVVGAEHLPAMHTEVSFANFRNWRELSRAFDGGGHRFVELDDASSCDESDSSGRVEMRRYSTQRPKVQLYAFTDVAKLVAGPMRLFGRVYICDRCAVQTIEVMEAHSGDDQPRREQPSHIRRILQRLGWDRPNDVSSNSECHAV